MPSIIYIWVRCRFKKPINSNVGCLLGLRPWMCLINGCFFIMNSFNLACDHVSVFTLSVSWIPKHLQCQSSFKSTFWFVIYFVRGLSDAIELICLRFCSHFNTASRIFPSIFIIIMAVSHLNRTLVCNAITDVCFCRNYDPQTHYFTHMFSLIRVLTTEYQSSCIIECKPAFIILCVQ